MCKWTKKNHFNFIFCLFFPTVAESESEWSETDDELLEPGIKKAKRDKNLQKQDKKVKTSKEGEKSRAKDAEIKEESSEEKDDQSGSQKSK